MPSVEVIPEKLREVKCLVNPTFHSTPSHLLWEVYSLPYWFKGSQIEIEFLFFNTVTVVANSTCSSEKSQYLLQMLKLIEFWLIYLRSKTHDRILKNSSKLIEIDKNLINSIHFVSKVINSTFKTLLGTSMSIRIIFKKPMRCFKCWINYFWDKIYRLHEILVYFYQFTGIF